MLYYTLYVINTKSTVIEYRERLYTIFEYNGTPEYSACSKYENIVHVLSMFYEP